jgi:hypothetical protein
MMSKCVARAAAHTPASGELYRFRDDRRRGRGGVAVRVGSRRNAPPTGVRARCAAAGCGLERFNGS